MPGLLLKAFKVVTGIESEVADLIESDPDGWKVDDYSITHRATGVYVWLGASKSYVRYKLDGGGEIEPSWEERFLIRLAAEALLAARRDRARREIATRTRGRRPGAWDKPHGR